MKKDYAVQGGVKNYLGKTEEVTAPKFWQSSPNSPKTELAYITDAEKGLLLEANLHGSLLDNKPNIGASGILSFDGFGSRDSSQNRAGGDVSRDMDRGRDDSGSRSSGGGTTTAFQGTQSNQFNTAMSQAQQDRAVAQNITDLVNNRGVNINDALSGQTTFERLTGSPFFSLNVAREILSPFANAANKKRRTSFFEGVDQFGMPRARDFFIANNRPFDPNATLIEGTAEYDFLDDSGYFDTIERTNNNSGDRGNVVFFDNPQDLKTVETNENSMVNNFFKNMGSNLGVSSSYMNTYNAAKNKISQSLNLTPNNQQYGFGNTFNDNFSRSMTSANPFFDELTNQGLI